MAEPCGIVFFLFVATCPVYGAVKQIAIPLRLTPYKHRRESKYLQRPPLLGANRRRYHRRGFTAKMLFCARSHLPSCFAARSRARYARRSRPPIWSKCVDRYSTTCSMIRETSLRCFYATEMGRFSFPFGFTSSLSMRRRRETSAKRNFCREFFEVY